MEYGADPSTGADVGDAMAFEAATQLTAPTGHEAGRAVRVSPLFMKRRRR